MIRTFHSQASKCALSCASVSSSTTLLSHSASQLRMLRISCQSTNLRHSITTAASSPSRLFRTSPTNRAANPNPSTPSPPPTPAAPIASDPPAMELPSFLGKFLQSSVRAVQRALNMNPHKQSTSQYEFAARNPLARPLSSKVQKTLAPLTASELLQREDALDALGLPLNDELTRYRLVGLHLWMIQKLLLLSNVPEARDEFIRFTAPSSPIPPLSKSELIQLQYLFEHFWSDLTPFLKEQRGEMKLTKTLISVQEYFYGSYVALDLAWIGRAKEEVANILPAPKLRASDPQPPPSSSPSPDSVPLPPREALAATIWRNFYLSDPTVSKRDVFRFIYYMQAQMEHLATYDRATLWADGHKLQWKSTAVIFDYTTGANSDAILASKLGITESVWKNPSFTSWQERLMTGNTFDTREASQKQ